MNAYIVWLISTDIYLSYRPKPKTTNMWQADNKKIH